MDGDAGVQLDPAEISQLVDRVGGGPEKEEAGAERYKTPGAIEGIVEDGSVIGEHAEDDLADSSGRKTVGRPRLLNPDGSFKYPKRSSVKRPRADGDSVDRSDFEKRSVGRPRKRNPDGSFVYPLKKTKRETTGSDGEPLPSRPRSDWLGDSFCRKEIFKALQEYDFAWLPTVHSLKQRFPDKFEKLGESTIRSWFEPGTRILRPQVLKKLERAHAAHRVAQPLDEDDPTNRIVADAQAHRGGIEEMSGAVPERLDSQGGFQILSSDLGPHTHAAPSNALQSMSMTEALLGKGLETSNLPPAGVFIPEPNADLRERRSSKRMNKRIGIGDQREATPKRAKSSTQLGTSISQPASVRFSDLGGIDSTLKSIQELVQWPLLHPEIYAWLGVEPPRGVLLHGPPGCGKTALANAIANECGVPFLRISAPEIVSGMSGESEQKIRQLFDEATQCAPSIVFIDEIDAIAGKRESAQREMERRIVAQMLTCMDDLSSSSQAIQKKHVLVIGATNRPDALDTALRRAGRFDREISLSIPTQDARKRILKVLVQKLRLSGDFDFDSIASKTPGFVGADLQALTKEAAALAVSRIFKSIQNDATTVLDTRREPLTEAELAGLAITMEDFDSAISKVQPSVRREGFATTPDVTWEDVGALEEVRDELDFAITQPIKNPERFAAMGLNAPSGVLLFGPPGCGKTLLAKAVANGSGANFISIKGPELLNKFVGESERAVRQVFARARAASPCVLFFDEMDALAPRRGSDSNQSSERVVNQLLTEMDGIDGRQGVYLIAATNRPDIIDKALLRPGRLDKMLYIPLPSREGRAQIASTLARSMPISEEVDIKEIARSCKYFSGADLGALVRDAATLALKASMRVPQNENAPPPKIEEQHFQAAKARITPSVSFKDQQVYNSLRTKLGTMRAHINEPQGAPSESEMRV